MIFILNSNPTSLSFYNSWLFNIVSEFGLLDIISSRPLFVYFVHARPFFVYLKVYSGLCLICLTLEVK